MAQRLTTASRYLAFVFLLTFCGPMLCSERWQAMEFHSTDMLGRERVKFDPYVGVDVLLSPSEDLRQIHNEWRRIWTNDQPSHMTPERVHGGIQ